MKNLFFYTLFILIYSSLGWSKTSESCNKGCLDYPGLAERNRFSVIKDIDLQPTRGRNGKIINESWNYFFEGKNITNQSQELIDFCAITFSQGHMPSKYKSGSLRTIPALSTSYELSEMSWYVNTIFLEAHDLGGELVGIVIYCNQGTSEITSKSRLLKHLGKFIVPFDESKTISIEGTFKPAIKGK